MWNWLGDQHYFAITVFFQITEVAATMQMTYIEVKMPQI